jgi:thiol-disulfide isomerase/thioredoxin
MKTNIFKLTILPALALLLVLAQPLKAGGIEFFQGSFSEAKALAAESNKLIFMDAYATWCGPCKWMSANSFTDERVGDLFNRNFINLKIDMERGEGPQLARQYRVAAYPTLFFLDANGEVVRKETGARDARGLLDLAGRILKAHAAPAEQTAEAAPGNDTPDAEMGAEAAEPMGDGERIVHDLSQAISSGDQEAFEAAIMDLEVSEMPEKDFVFLEAHLVWMEEHGDQKTFVTAVEEYIALAATNNADLRMMAAVFFYELDLEEAQLRKAQGWAEESIALLPGYYNHDINALLLHRLGEKEEAIRQAELALQFANQDGIDGSQTEAFLAEVRE